MVMTGDQAARMHAEEVNRSAEARGVSERHRFRNRRGGWCCEYHDGYADGWDAGMQAKIAAVDTPALVKVARDAYGDGPAASNADRWHAAVRAVVRALDLAPASRTQRPAPPPANERTK